jgi:hypothetical protein
METGASAQKIVKGEDLKVAIEAQPQVQQPAEVVMRVVDVVPEGFRPVTDQEHGIMIEFGRQYELVLMKKRAVDAEMREKQREYRDVLAEIGGIRVMLDGIRNKMGVHNSGDLVQERKTGKLWVPITKEPDAVSKNQSDSPPA